MLILALPFPNWKNGTVEGFEVAENCDFGGNDLYSLNVTSADECQNACRNELRCDHFAFSYYTGNNKI